MARKRNNDVPPEPKEKHSLADKKLELELMLMPPGGTLTAGGFFRLWMSGNPFVTGGEPTEEDIEQFLVETGTKKIEDAIAVLDASFRPLDCVQDTSKKGEEPYDGICPEYLADLVASATKSCPMTWHQATEEISLCTLTHLVLATCRANNVKTGRPKDFSELDKWILKRNGIKPKHIGNK